MTTPSCYDSYLLLLDFLIFISSLYFYLAFCFANSFVLCSVCPMYLFMLSILPTILFIAWLYLLSYFMSFVSPSLSFYDCYYLFTMLFAFRTVYCIPYCIPTCLISFPTQKIHYSRNLATFSCLFLRLFLFYTFLFSLTSLIPTSHFYKSS